VWCAGPIRRTRAAEARPSGRGGGHLVGLLIERVSRQGLVFPEYVGVTIEPDGGRGAVQCSMRSPGRRSTRQAFPIERLHNSREEEFRESPGGVCAAAPPGEAFPRTCQGVRSTGDFYQDYRQRRLLPCLRDRNGVLLPVRERGREPAARPSAGRFELVTSHPLYQLGHPRRGRVEQWLRLPRGYRPPYLETLNLKRPAGGPAGSC